MATRTRRAEVAAKRTRRSTGGKSTDPILAQLDRIQAAGGDGVLELGRNATLHVSSLDKVYFPKDGFSKGDVMRYYATIAR